MKSVGEMEDEKEKLGKSWAIKTKCGQNGQNIWAITRNHHSERRMANTRKTQMSPPKKKKKKELKFINLFTEVR